MTMFDTLLFTIFTFLPLGITIGLIVWFVRQQFADRRHSSGETVLQFSLWLLIAIWFLRYAVNFYMLRYSDDPEAQILNPAEQVINSFLHALQTFSMDEDYTAYIMGGKEMVSALTGSRLCTVIYGFFASLLNLAAPIAGGAILFEILTSFFPDVRLFFAARAGKRPVYFFSILSDSSLALAESGRKAWERRAAIVFADVYADASDEAVAERMEAAKRIGAICVKTDLTQLRCKLRGPRTYFLMNDEDGTYTGTDNLHMLITMAEQKPVSMLKNAEVFLFTDDDLYEQAAGAIAEMLEQNGCTKDDMPAVTPVTSFQNLISNLLTDYPLFAPLLPERTDIAQRQTLQLTILGIGSIGMQMLCSAYWCGQMLGCTLYINVISVESPEEFDRRLHAVNPDLTASAEAGNAILRINGNGAYAPPYCTLRYFQADVQTEEFQTLLSSPAEPPLLDTHYFVAALGSDAANIRAADVLRTAIGRHHLRCDQPRRTLIAYAVYDAELSRALNRDPLKSSGAPHSHDIYMHAFGSLEEEYSVENIMMPQMFADAEQMHRTYRDLQPDLHVQRRKDAAQRHKDYYTYWANITRNVHTQYKLFSAGVKLPSVFAPDEAFDWGRASEAFRLLTQQEYACRDTLSAEARALLYEACIANAVPENAAEFRVLQDRIAWLEHRRWTAFLRTRGFTAASVDVCIRYAARTGNHKELQLKLHPCLVECDDCGMKREYISENDTVRCVDKLREQVEAAGNDPAQRGAFDYLDLLTYALRYQHTITADDGTQRGIIDYDFKRYDYADTYEDQTLSHLRRCAKRTASRRSEM